MRRTFLAPTLTAGVLLACLATVSVAKSPDVNSTAAQAATVELAAPFERLQHELEKQWPHNRMVRIVFHGHSVPAGYFKTPIVRAFDAYPSLFHRQLCEQYPTAVIDVSVTAIGGENAVSGAARFERDVLSLRPDLVFIDYCLNDRRVGLENAAEAWRSMIRNALDANVRVVLLTPTPDLHEDILDSTTPLGLHAQQVRDLAEEFGVSISDSYAAFANRASAGEDLQKYMAQGNHPNRAGHEIVASELSKLMRAQAN